MENKSGELELLCNCGVGARPAHPFDGKALRYPKRDGMDGTAGDTHQAG